MTKIEREYLKLYSALIMTVQPPTFGSILRARLLAALQREGRTVTSVAGELGRGRLTYSRKLNVSHSAARALTTDDVDTLVAHLGLDPADLLQPVLLPHDVKILQVINDQRASGRGAPVQRQVGDDTLSLICDNGRSEIVNVELTLARLESQALIRAADEYRYLTPAGSHLLTTLRPVRA